MTMIGRLAAVSALLTFAGTAAVAQTETGQGVQNTVGMVKALEAAEASVKGRAIEAELETESGRLVYEIDVVRGADEIHEVIVDAGTGEVVSSDKQTVEGLWTRWVDSGTLTALQSSEYSLGRAVADAEAQTGGVVREVSLDKENDHPVYELEVTDRTGNEIELKIDAVTGETLKKVED